MGPVLPADLAYCREASCEADAVVLEENENNIDETKQVGNMLDAMRAME